MTSCYNVINSAYQLLRGMFDKSAKRCSPLKALDPLLVLPVELAEMVAKYLSFKNIV